MGALAERVAARGSVRKGPRCDTGKWLLTLPTELRADLADLLNNPTVKSKFIAEELTGLGFPLGYSSVQRHRRGDCGCGAEAA